MHAWLPNLGELRPRAEERLWQESPTHANAVAHLPASQLVHKEVKRLLVVLIRVLEAAGEDVLPKVEDLLIDAAGKKAGAEMI